MISFNDFFHKHKLKNEATSNLKIQNILGYIGLNNVEIYLKDRPFPVILELLIYIHQKEHIDCIHKRKVF